MALEKELAYYKSQLPNLATEEGKYVLVHSDSVVGIYSTYDDALVAAYDKFGVNDKFLVKQIQAVEQIQFISRFSAPN